MGVRISRGVPNKGENVLKLEEITELLEMVKEGEQFKPLADEVERLLIDVYGPNFKKLIKTMSLALTDISCETYKRYKALDISNELAVALVISQKQLITTLMENSLKGGTSEESEEKEG